MLTNTDHEAFIALAGPDFMWSGVSGSSRPASDVRKELRLDLIERQGGICPVCGNEARFPQYNHVVSRGPGVKGFIPGNIFAGCAVCNLECALTFGTVNEDDMVVDGGIIPLSHFKRPDVIPTEWTPFPILRERNKR